MERLQQITTTPPNIHVTENQHGDEGEEAEVEGTTDFSLEGISNVGSEMERVHITEKNKSMAAKLKVIATQNNNCLTRNVLYEFLYILSPLFASELDI